MTAPTPPRARREPTERTFHGDTVIDDYEWLRDRESPEVIAHLEAENAYTDAMTGQLKPLADTIFGEIKAHTKETDLSVPVRMGAWWYFTRTIEGEQYAVHARSPYRHGDVRPDPQPGAELPGEQVLLDGNAESAGHDFFELGDLSVSHDGAMLAVSLDLAGDEIYDVSIREAATGQVIDAAVREVGAGIVWSADGRYVFYTRRDDAWRPHEVWRHEVGTPAEQDVLIVREDDEEFALGIGESRDERWLLVMIGSSTTTEAHLLDLTDPTGALRVVQPRIAGLDYDVEVDGDRILVVHNASRVDFDLAQAPLATPGREHWTPVMSGADGDRILGADAFADFVVVTMRHAGLRTLRWLPKANDGALGEPRDIPVEPELHTLALGANPEYDLDTVQLVLTSWLTPSSVYDFTPATGELTLLKQREVPGYDQAAYVEERLWVTADDGTQVPVSFLHRRDVTADGSNPGLIYGYGSYEISMDPSFAVSRLSLLDRGVVYAIAHVRGGGELGRRWYDEGKLLAKRNTFTDFVAASRAMIDLGWVRPDRLAAQGGSAGGLLMGAITNLAPELYAAIHADVPFVDALTTILDPSLPLTAGEWQEWGNPIADPDVYAYMKSYTPYENIRATRYPAILATTSLHDTRVFYVEPAKWVQRLRATVAADDARPVLLRTEIAAGHGGRSGRYDGWRQTAFELAFVLDCIGAAE
ncbi:S9 family peptidase [Flexivirga caeni]|uniref:S9 family peptidase n=1 Tax=Flexivirga caeni TaxID=2294115 RepID=A0A3M9MFE8_9MICO|nr:S9 family peptidase [Flexivirga caeni]RNI24224.1 S9 family peptidase [Flexivirga caeni]